MNAEPLTAAPKISASRALVLFVAVLLLAVPQAALLPLIDRDEPRFAEAAREMIQTGNFVVPHFNGVPRYDKPPLSYWCQAGAYEIFGENAFAARLPSLLATAATALLIYAWGVRLGREWIGLAAALSYAFCLQTMQQGRVATADALLIFFMTLTAFAGWLILRPSSGSCAPTACYIVLALGFAGGFLAKGRRHGCRSSRCWPAVKESEAALRSPSWPASFSSCSGAFPRTWRHMATTSGKAGRPG